MDDRSERILAILVFDTLVEIKHLEGVYEAPVDLYLLFLSGHAADYAVGSQAPVPDRLGYWCAGRHEVYLGTVEEDGPGVLGQQEELDRL